MLYLAIIGLSVCSCAIGFLLEIVEANVRHVQNGRQPNASAALFPNIPMVQLTYFLAAWGLNQVNQNVGYAFVALYALVSMAIRFWRYRRSSGQLRSLIASTHATSAKAPSA